MLYENIEHADDTVVRFGNKGLEIKFVLKIENLSLHFIKTTSRVSPYTYFVP